MAKLYRSPFGRGDAEWGVDIEIPPKPEDVHPRSHPEDRSEGSLNPDPVLESWTTSAGPHSPSGEPSDDDGAGNISPREVVMRYGQEDADEFDLGPT